MTEYYLASSALIEESYDGQRTIEEAKAAGFDGVQLFLDPRYHEQEYRQNIKKLLKESGLGLVVHLPNVVGEEDRIAAEAIANDFPDAKFLIHYEPTVETPDIEGVLVGWENSRVGIFNDEQRGHIKRAKDKAQKDGTFFV